MLFDCARCFDLPITVNHPTHFPKLSCQIFEEGVEIDGVVLGCGKCLELGDYSGPVS